MSKAADGLNTATEHAKPSRRRALTMLAASPVIAGLPAVALAMPAKPSGYSPKIAAAFAEWQKAVAAFDAAMEAESAAEDRYHALLPEQSKWKRPLNPEQKAACDAAREMSELAAADEAGRVAWRAQHELFLAFLGLQPETMGDVVLQATKLKEWMHDCEAELPMEVWLEAVTGEEWPDHVLNDAGAV